MREILFRGRTVLHPRWVAGHYVYRADIPGHFIVGVNSYGTLIWWEVDPESVGQYTGLKDRDGRRIFEGDILRYFDDEIQVVEWSSEWSQIMLHTYGERERKQGRKTVKDRNR